MSTNTIRSNPFWQSEPIPELITSGGQLVPCNAAARALTQDVSSKHSEPAVSDKRVSQELITRNQITTCQKVYRCLSVQMTPSAQFELGQMYEKGTENIQANPVEAIRWYRFAANQGFAPAQTALGICYEKGIGTKADAAHAANLFRLAADQDFALAQLRLALCYLKKIGVEHNPAKAIVLFQLAAAQNLPEAQTCLSSCYLNGTEVPKDEAEGIRLLHLAIEKADPSAHTLLGFCYLSGHGVVKDAKEAVRLFRIAAEQHFPPAQTALGECFLDGTGVEKNENEGIYWNQLAAKQGFHPAQFNLAMCYLKGTGGLQRDPITGIRLLKEAAKKKSAEAQYELGRRYEYGEDISMDPSQAAYWYTRASEEDHEEGLLALSDCYSHGFGVMQDMRKSKELLDHLVAISDDVSADALSRLKDLRTHI